MRFEFCQTKDKSFTIYDSRVGECYKSQHAAHTESYEVFIRRGIEENSLFSSHSPFTIVELGFGLGTNLSCLMERVARLTPSSSIQFFSFEKDLSAFYHLRESSFRTPHYIEFQEAIEKNKTQKPFPKFQYKISRGDFFECISSFEDNSIDCVFYDPFSPKASKESWEKNKIQLLFPKMKQKGRIVSYSVSAIAKEAFTSSGFRVEKSPLPPILQKRESLIAIKE